MVVNLGGSQNIVTQPQTTMVCTTLTVLRVVDLPERQEVRALIKECGRFVILWSGGEYDSNMAWNKAAVEARLISLAATGFTYV
jgi:hypothetical protein